MEVEAVAVVAEQVAPMEDAVPVAAEQEKYGCGCGSPPQLSAYAGAKKKKSGRKGTRKSKTTKAQRTAAKKKSDAKKARVGRIKRSSREGCTSPGPVPLYLQEARKKLGSKYYTARWNKAADDLE